MFLTTREEKSKGDNQSITVGALIGGAKGALIGWKIKVLKYNHIHTSIDYKFYVLSEKYKNHMLKTHRNPSQGSIALCSLARWWYMKVSMPGHITRTLNINRLQILCTCRKVEELHGINQTQAPTIIAKFSFLACPHPFLPASRPPSQSEVL